jgi:hypothetical protein
LEKNSPNAGETPITTSSERLPGWASPVSVSPRVPSRRRGDIWTTETRTNYNLAAIALQPLNGNNVADLAGSQGYKFNYGYEWQAYEFGYPFDTHPARNGITGQQLRYCVGQTWRPGISPFQPDQQAIHCDQGHGASGGPWLDDLQLDRGWGYLVGNVSYHPDDNSDEERSPHFGDAAVNVYNNQQNA